jgi:hypothetical protein
MFRSALAYKYVGKRKGTDMGIADWWWENSGWKELTDGDPTTLPLSDGSGQSAVEKVTSNDDTTLSQPRYNFNYRAFPNDLGMDYAGHYMVININVPVYPGGSDRGSYSNQYETMRDQYSKVDVLRFGRGANPGSVSQRESYSIPRRTRRIVESIALYMPGSQLVYNGMNTYEEISLTALAGQIGTSVLQNAGTAAGYLAGGKQGGEMVGGAIGNILGMAGNAVGTAMKLAGTPINPRVEVTYSNTLLREFLFEFLMMPRNAEEAKTIHDIIRTLRFHAAPEITNQLGVVPTFIPPAEFDITFFHRGSENTKIPRINTCVLARCEVDYAPGTGIYSTFRDGHPVATRLQLFFKEVEIVHKLRVLQNF